MAFLPVLSTRLFLQGTWLRCWKRLSVSGSSRAVAEFPLSLSRFPLSCISYLLTQHYLAPEYRQVQRLRDNAGISVHHPRVRPPTQGA